MSPTTTHFNFYFSYSIKNCPHGLIDLFNIFARTYEEDITNEGNHIEVTVALQNCEPFERLKTQLEEVINFMAGEDGRKWSYNFKKDPCEQTFHPQQIKLLEEEVEHVALLSGGLDSFCGLVYDLACENEQTFDYVSYKNNNIDISRARKNLRPLIRSNNHRLVEFKRLDTGKKIIYTQRSRSLLFFGLAIVHAFSKGVRKVILTENGVMSLNPAMDTRVTTKTTHPKIIRTINFILSELDIDIELYHRCLFDTKGDMVERIPSTHRHLIKHTMTCGQSRQNSKWKEELQGHCGACVPCVLRRISLVSKGLGELDDRYNEAFREENELHEDFLSSVDYFRRMKAAIDDGTIMSRVKIRSKYYTNKNYFTKTKDMFSRFAEEMSIFFDTIDAGGW